MGDKKDTKKSVKRLYGSQEMPAPISVYFPNSKGPIRGKVRPEQMYKDFYAKEYGQ